MFTKKILLLLGIALMAASATPAAAYETGELTHEGSPIGEDIELELEGPLEVNSLGTGMKCSAKYDYKYTKNNKAVDVTSYKPDTATCVGIGMLKDCKVVADKATKLPWEGVVTKEGAAFTDATVDYTFDSECPLVDAELKIPTLELKADKTKKFTEFTFFPTGATIDFGFGHAKVTVSGTAALLSGAGTYEIV